jgi:putative membrane protein
VVMIRNFGFLGGFSWIGLIINAIIVIALVVALIVLIVWAIRSMRRSSEHTGMMTTPAQSAREIAQLRYARGEITREQYQQILADLEH